MTMPGGLNATATAVLRFDASAVRPGVMDANSALQQLYGTVRDNWWGIRNLGEVLAGLGGIIAGGLGAATASAVSWEQSTMTVFKNLSDSAKLTDADFKRIRDGIIGISESTPVALNELVKMANMGALFGISSNEIVDFTKKVAELSIGTNLTTADIENLIKVMNEFQLPVDQIDRVGSALFNVEKATASTVPQILTVTRQYGSMLHAIGATVDQSFALSAAFVSMGAQAQSSATALSNLFIHIGQAASNNLPLFNNYATVAGLTSEQFRKMITDTPVPAMLKVIEGLSNVKKNTIDLGSVMDDLGIRNVRQAKALTDLASSFHEVQDGQVGLVELMRRADAAMRDTTDYQREVERQSKTTAAQITLLKNDFHVMANGIGAEVLPSLLAVVHVLQNVVLGFAQLPDGVRQGIVLFGGLTGGTLLLVGALALIVPRLVQAAAAVRGLGESMLAYEAIQRAAVALTLEQEGAEAAAALTKVRWGASRRAAVYEVIAAEEAFQASLATTMAMETAWLGVETTKTIALEAATEAEAASAAMIALRAEIQAAALAGDGARIRVLAAQLPAYTEASVAATAHALATAADAEAALAAAAALEIETAAIVAEEAAAATATPIAIAFGAALDFMTGPIGLVIIGITAIVAGIATLMYFMGRATKATDEYKNANAELSRQLSATGADVRGLTDAFLLQQDGMLHIIHIAEQAGVKISELFAVIRGDATDDVRASVVSKLNKAIADGVPGAQEAVNAIQHYHEVVLASQGAAQKLTQANKELGHSTDGVTASSLGLEDAASKAKSAVEVRANAEIALISAERSLKDATTQVADAEQRLAEARQGLADRSFNIKALEDDVASARMSEKDATEALAKAEEDLKRARSDAAAQLQMDKLNLAKAKAQEVLDTLNLAKAQDELNGAQNASDADLASKTERLADARKLLFQATKDASDAEYNLMTLKAQGASAEDIAAAQRRVNDAKNNTKTAQVAVDDLGATSTKADDPNLDAAQSAYNLAAAQQSLAATQQTILDLTNKVSREQKDAARDKTYKDAVDKVTQAQINLRQAQERTRTAVRDLKREMATNPEAKAYADAQKAVGDALFARAQAVVQVKKYQFELSGQTFTTQQEVVALKNALIDQANQVKGPLHDALLGYAGQLDGVAKKIGGMDTTIPPLKGPDTSQASKNINAVGTQIEGLHTEHKGILDRIFDSRGIGPSLRISLHELGDTLRGWGEGVGPLLKSGFDLAWKGIIASAKLQFDVFFKSLPTPLQLALTEIGKSAGEAFAFAMKGTLQILEGPINIAIDAVNGLISGIQWVNKYTPFGNPLPDVHHLDKVSFHAEGGVFDKPHLGMVAEAGPEAVMPIATLTDMMRPILLLTAQLVEQQRSMALLGLQRSSVTGADSSVNNYHRNYSMVFNNPTPERASDDIPRALRKIEFVGD